MNFFSRLFRYFYRLIYCKLNPVGYARSLGVKVGENVRFYGANQHMFSTEPWLITIGDNVHITEGVQFLTHDGGTLIVKKEVPNFVVTGRITIGNDVYIGIRSVILPGVTISNRCIIGACSVISRDIPDNSVAVGTPARVISSVDNYVDKLNGIIAGDNQKFFSDLTHMHSLKFQK